MQTRKQTKTAISLLVDELVDTLYDSIEYNPQVETFLYTLTINKSKRTENFYKILDYLATRKPSIRKQHNTLRDYYTIRARLSKDNARFIKSFSIVSKVVKD